jgi:predicted ATPase
MDLPSATRTPLVGRDRELGLLRDALARVRAERAPRLITLVGVPEIGKSRLVWELRELVEADPDLIVWRLGRCLPYGDGVALWALGEIVKAQTGILETDPADVAAGKLTQAVADLLTDPSEAAWVVGHLRALVGLVGGAGAGGGHREEAFAAWRRFVTGLAEPGPAVLVIEDLHWADDVLLDFLEQLIERAGEVALLVVATARPELLTRRPGWAGATPGSAVVELPALSDQDTAELVGGLLDQARLPAELQRALLARAGGNPLYAEEYVRMLADQGLLRQAGSGWRLDHAAQLPPPATVHGIIAARLDALPAQDKALLQDAAVLGEVGWLGGLAALTKLDRARLEARLRDLERRELVRRERRSRVAGERQYAFRHVLIRDVAYGQLPRMARAERHRRAARWLQALSPDRAEARDLLLAQGDREGAAEAEAMLGLLLWKHGHGERAMAHRRQAVALLDGAAPSPAKAAVLASLTAALAGGGHSAEAIETGRQALAMAEALGLDQQQARTLNYVGWRGSTAGTPAASATSNGRSRSPCGPTSPTP